MKILESAPSRYDKGINLVTLGRMRQAYACLASRIAKGWMVLDIGCGTGAMTIRAAQRGARVVGIDVNAQMLEIAIKHVEEMRLSSSVELREQGMAELPNEPAGKYDAATASLVFSELSEDERAFALLELRRLLKPGGLLLIADETKPSGLFRKLLFWLLRIPLAALTYILTQLTTNPIERLPETVAAAGFIIEEQHTNWLGNLTLLICRNPAIQG